MSNEGTWAVGVRQFPGHCHSMPSRGPHSIEFFSDLVSEAEAIAIGQVKEIPRHARPTPLPHSRS